MATEDSSNKFVVTRFPPSPTGFFHLGSVRTALFNYLFARHYGANGRFILRIEDTDAARNKKEYEDNIIESLKWLGLEWDDFARQSDRTAIYKEHLEKLIASAAAYISKEKIEKEGDRPEVIRFKNPGTKVTFADEIRGQVSFDTTELGDFIIARSVTEPLYHFTAIVDDFLMGITHVIRGEEHISNTPRQILIQEALGAPRPIYAHLPLILAPDRSKLSKRKHGEQVSLDHYMKAGFLREAIINYMALLGWNPGTDALKGGSAGSGEKERELYSLAQLVQLFDLHRVQKAGAIFNEEKLRWFNKEYLHILPKETLVAELKKILDSHANSAVMPVISDDLLKKITPILLERASTFGDIQKMLTDGELDYIFSSPKFNSPENVSKISWKKTSPEKTKIHLEKIKVLVSAIPESAFTAELSAVVDTVKAAVWSYAEAEGRGEVLWPFRYALSGREKSPDPFTLAGLLGKDETLARLTAAISVVE